MERIAWELEVSEVRKRRPERLYRSEEDLERRRTHAEWLPEGDDEDETGESMLYACCARIHADQKKRQSNAQRTFPNLLDTTKRKRHSIESSRTSQNLLRCVL